MTWGGAVARAEGGQRGDHPEEPARGQAEVGAAVGADEVQRLEGGAQVVNLVPGGSDVVLADEERHDGGARDDAKG